MNKINSILAGILAVMAAPAVLAQSINCAALSNSGGLEPAGYAQQCAFTPSSAMSAPAPSAPTDTAFVYNVRAGTPNLGLARHTLNNMPGITNVGNPGLTVFAMDFNVSNDTLYILDSTAAAPAPPVLRTLNQTTGAPTTIATVTGLPAGASPTDLVINPQTGAAFVSTADTLFSFNLTTAVATPIGVMAAGQIMIDLAINCAGQMYGHSITDDSLYSVNSTTGAATRIGGHGLAANFAQGMDFDNQDGQLYAWVYTGGGTYTFGTFNLMTGAITPINTNTPPGEWEGAIRNTCGVVAADLALTQSNNAAGNALLVGNTFQKTLTVTNNGPSTATGITVTDTLPAQLTFVSSNCGATATGQVVTYTIPTLANGATHDCVLTVRVASSGTIVNTAAITSSTPADPAPANNTTSAQIGPTGGGIAQTAVPALDLKSVLVLLGLVSALGMLALRQRQA